jgi:lysophospholipase L1-like esterase
VSLSTVQIHPGAERLPFTHQGPFVTTGDGAVLCFDERLAHRSRDEGITWESYHLFSKSGKYHPSTERALLQTRSGVTIAAWVNLVEKQHAPDSRWGGPPHEFAQWILPTYVSRSHDNGRTWDEPILLNRPWCGCLHSMIQTRSGRIVLVAQEIIPAWRHGTVMFLSDDDGLTWQRSTVLDNGVGRHDHAGSCEGTVIQRADDSLYLLLRNESGFLAESVSTDEGLTWSPPRLTAIPSVTCCAQLNTLADGTVTLLWNPPPRYEPAAAPAPGQAPVERAGLTARDELALSLSSDGGATWEPPVIVAADYSRVRDLPEYVRASYPYLYERRPGELWITTMYGDVRMRLHPANLSCGEIPFPPLVVLFGDSTTARRPAEVESVYGDRLKPLLAAAGINHTVANRGVPGDNTAHALARFERDVSALNPDLVVMQFGLNDAAVDVWRDPPAKAPRVALADYIANLSSMIRRLKERGVSVVLMTPNRMYWSPLLLERYDRPPYDGANPEIFNQLHLDSYAAAMRDLAARENVPLVDINQTYVDSGNPAQFLLKRCMQHPNDTGHELVAKLLAPVVIAELRKRDSGL